MSETRIYRVVFNAIPSGASAARDASGVPAYGASITTSGVVCYVRDKQATAVDGTALVYLVAVTYESLSSGSRGDEISDPIARPFTVDIEPEEQAEEYTWDADGLLVGSSAGELFKKGLTRDSSSTLIIITRNEPSTGTGAYNPMVKAAYSNTLNNANVVICGTTYNARKCRMKPVKATYIIEGSYKYWRVTYTIVVPTSDIATAWDQKVADVGTYAVSGGITLPIRKADGSEYPTPYPLDGAGNAKTLYTDDPATLTFHPYTAVDWTPLALPTALP